MAHVFYLLRKSSGYKKTNKNNYIIFKCLCSWHNKRPCCRKSILSSPICDKNNTGNNIYLLKRLNSDRTIFHCFSQDLQQNVMFERACTTESVFAPTSLPELPSKSQHNLSLSRKAGCFWWSSGLNLGPGILSICHLTPNDLNTQCSCVRVCVCVLLCLSTEAGYKFKKCTPTFGPS